MARKRETRVNESADFRIGPFPVKFRGPHAVIGTVMLALLLGTGYLVYFNLGRWGTPINLEDKLDTLLDQHDASIYVLAMCLNQTQQTECKDVASQMQRPKYLDRRFGSSAMSRR